MTHNNSYDGVLSRTRDAIRATDALDAAQKADLLAVLEKLPYEVLVLVQEISVYSPADLMDVLAGVKEREEILASGSPDRWEAFLEKEKEALKRLTAIPAL